MGAALLHLLINHVSGVCAEKVVAVKHYLDKGESRGVKRRTISPRQAKKQSIMDKRLGHEDIEIVLRLRSLRPIIKKSCSDLEACAKTDQ